MQTKKFSSLGLEINLNVPSTVEEFDQNAGKTGACLDEAINNVVYRGMLAEYREALLHGLPEVKDAAGNITRPAIDGLETITGIERPTKEVKNADGSTKTRKVTNPDGTETVEPVLVYADPGKTESDFLEFVCAQKGWTSPEAKKANIQPLADKIAAALVFDAKASERKPTAPKTLGKDYKVAAERVFANGNLDKALAAIGSQSKAVVTLVEEPTDTASEEYKAARAKNVESLGWAIKANEDWKRAQALQTYA